MPRLQAFSKPDDMTNEGLHIEADLQILSQDTLEIKFNWSDEKKLIVFADNPSDLREYKLWEQTCFEAFIRPTDGTRYFEINLTLKKAWNVFEFTEYRSPQPPKEFKGAKILNFNVQKNQLSVQIKFEAEHFRNINVSLCAILVLKERGMTYWSTQHADLKPNFHHFESLLIERTAP